MMRMKQLPFIVAVCIVALCTALVLAAPIVLVNGGAAKIRVIMQGEVPYVAAPDIAEALGTTFQMDDGKLVFGAQGGRYADAGVTAEKGKWAFNGKIRMRIVDPDPKVKCRGQALGVEVANATDRKINPFLNGYFEFYENDQIVKEAGYQSHPQIPPGGHAIYTICYSHGDLLIFRPAKGHEKQFGSLLKLKLELE